MSSRKPLVAVLIPTYDRPFWFRQSLLSVAKQVGIDLQTIVMLNGGSRSKVESAYESVCEFEHLLGDLSVIEEVDNSMHNIPKMYEHIDADYMVQFTDDDLMHSPSNLSFKATLAESVGAGIVYSPAQAIDFKGDKLLKDIGYFGEEHKYVTFNDLITTSIIPMPSALIRVDDFFKHPPQHHELVGDEWCHHLEMANAGVKIMYSPARELVRLRLHDSSVTEVMGNRGGEFTLMHQRVHAHWKTRGWEPLAPQLSGIFAMYTGESGSKAKKKMFQEWMDSFTGDIE